MGDKIGMTGTNLNKTLECDYLRKLYDELIDAEYEITKKTNERPIHLHSLLILVNAVIGVLERN